MTSQFGGKNKRNILYGLTASRFSLGYRDLYVDIHPS
jgi:hypothetical protein